MITLYQMHIQKLEKLMEEARMTPNQMRTVYSIAESFLADGGFAYSTAFSSSCKWPSDIEERLSQAQNEIIELGKELMKRQDSVED